MGLRKATTYSSFTSMAVRLLGLDSGLFYYAPPVTVKIRAKQCCSLFLESKKNACEIPGHEDAFLKHGFPKLERSNVFFKIIFLLVKGKFGTKKAHLPFLTSHALKT